MRLTVLGARGSVPVGGTQTNIYGGETSCYLVDAGDYVIFLDAGTGLLKAPRIDENKEIIILLSHPHIDHLLGLPLFDEMASPNRKITVYGRTMGGISTSEQIRGLFSKLYWPVTPWDISKNFQCSDPDFPLVLKSIVIETAVLPHPGGCLGYRISYKGKSAVYMTDCELNEGGIERLSEFAKDSDLLLCDSQYTAEEYEGKRGFGHSTIDNAIKLMEKSCSKKMLLIHHDPHRTDKQLEEMEKDITDTRICFARSGMQIEL